MTHKLATLAAASLVLSLACVCAAQQTTPAAPSSQTPAPRAPQIAPGANAAADARRSRAPSDEDFELNISERHIVEESFAASTAAELGGEDGERLNLRVGVAVGAERIDVWLRNVRGRVRFRSTLGPLIERLGARLAEPRPPSP